MNERVIKWQEYGETVMHPTALVVVVVMGLALFCVPRRRAILPIIMASLFLTGLQRVVIAGLDFDVLRIMTLLGYTRILLRGEVRPIKLVPLDKILLLWTVCAIFFYTILIGTPDALINRLGGAVSGIGLYFLFRFLIRDFEDLRFAAKSLILVGIPISLAMACEQVTGRNLFGALGGVPEITLVRDGRLRAQAAFTHAILAGTFGASLVPFCLALWPRGGSRGLAIMGLGAATLMTVASASSGPVMSFLAAFAAASFWLLRKRMRVVRWIAAITLTGLHFSMQAPVWALINRVAVVGGSTAYHRYRLIDMFINNWSQWWICGSTAAASWGWGLQDITNQYVRVGLEGGLISLVLFMMVIVSAFRAAGVARKTFSGNKNRAFLCWMLGATLFVHVVSFMGISYFDQTILIWYLLLAMIASAHALALKARFLRKRHAPEKARHTQEQHAQEQTP